MDGINILLVRLKQISDEASALKQEAIIGVQELDRMTEIIEDLKPEDLNDPETLDLLRVMKYKKQTLMKEQKERMEKLDKLHNECEFIGALIGEL